ncbi:hypothetical protein Nepgr_025229 [Nepenthes gracilis]|uniref:Uncharacterized protein n=1 Tax=Nepenthes gracilis TaxID=150966 RepID=A0AAD3Y199_NEPGR|nr:hypothetical protein Nepgr_025229 [Nepenthes gracilis]
MKLSLELEDIDGGAAGGVDGAGGGDGVGDGGFPSEFLGSCSFRGQTTRPRDGLRQIRGAGPMYYSS